MEILLIGVGYRGYTTWYAKALQGLGHSVTTYIGLRERHLPTRMRRLTQVRVPTLFGVARDYLWSEQAKLRGWLRRRQDRWDLVLFANSDRLATDETLGELSQRGIASGLWLLDDVGTLSTSNLDLRSFDHLASFNSHDARELQAQLGRPFLHVPQGFAPIDFVPQIPASRHALVLGAAYPSRRRAVVAMLDAGLHVDVVGRTWPSHAHATERLRLLGDVTLSQSLAISAGGRICVNAHRSPTAGVSPRVFEIGGAGGLLVSDHKRAPMFFEPGVEMLHWAEPEEAADHAARAQRDRSAASRIAAAGRRRTLSDHTMERRFATLLSGWGFV